MTLLGHIQDGQVVFDVPVSLPNGTPVRVETADPMATTVAQGEDGGLPRTLAERLKNFMKHQVELPEDAALNHDHYLYDAPKK